MQKIWGEKPYRSLDWQLKNQFGEKVYKLALNGGMSCPNRDGKVGRGGCIFCSEGGSGDFAADGHLSVTEQIAFQKESLRKKKPASGLKSIFSSRWGYPASLRARWIGLPTPPTTDSRNGLGK